MQAEIITYHQENTAMYGYLAKKQETPKPRPAVMIVHDWAGRNDLYCQKAELLANMGYVGFSVDMYGDGRVGETTDEKMSLMQPLMNDRSLIRSRLLAALDTVRSFDEVDAQNIAVIGYCFGGLCALDLARSGADIQGAVSFHGLLTKPEGMREDPINTRILALHGYADPMVPPEQVKAFCDEMTIRGADWQIHMYGGVKHAFTNPTANDEQLGTVYNAIAAERSWQAMTGFLAEIF